MCIRDRPPAASPGDGGARAGALRAKPKFKFSAMPAGQVPGKRRHEGCASDLGRPQALALWGALVHAVGDSCVLGRQL
eukprot:1410141-Alexandrium_andersonii.AAC.1